ncbi:hypothetical protein P9112_004230 [Eukaryota sp. TZLM1-RC]
MVCETCGSAVEDLQSQVSLREMEVSDLTSSLDTLRAVITMLQRDNDDLQYKLDSCYHPSSTATQFDQSTPHSSVITTDASTNTDSTPSSSPSSPVIPSSPSQASSPSQDQSSLAMALSDLTTENSLLSKEIRKLEEEKQDLVQQLEASKHPHHTERDPKESGILAEMKGYEHRIRNLSNENTKLNGKLQSVQQELAVHRQQKTCSDQLTALNQSIIQENQQLVSKIDDIEAENLTLLETLNSLAGKLESSQNKCVTLQLKNKELENITSNSEAKAIRLSHELAETASRLAKLRVSRSPVTKDQNDDVVELKNSLDASRKEIFLAESLRLKAENRAQKLGQKVETLEEKIKGMNQSIYDQRLLNERQLLELKELKQSNSELKKRVCDLHQLENHLSSLKDELASHEQDRLIYEQARQYWMSERESLEEQRKQVEERMANEKETGISEQQFNQKVKENLDLRKENQRLSQQVKGLQGKIKSTFMVTDRSPIDESKENTEKGYSEILLDQVPRIEVDFSQYLSPSQK